MSPGRILEIILAVVASGLLCTNIFLQSKVKELSRHAAELESFQGPSVGSTVRNFSGYNLQNLPVNVATLRGTTKSLILVLAVGCRACDDNWVFWNRILQHAASARIVFADVSGLVTSEYFQVRGVSAPREVVKLSIESRWANNFNATPLTIVVSPTGQVEHIWVGILTNEKVRQVQQALPGNAEVVAKKEEEK